MGVRDDIMAVKEQLKEVKQMKEESFAMELLSEQKKANKRLFVALMVVLTFWFMTIGYLVWLLNDIGTSTETIDIQDVDSIDNSTIEIGDELWAQ